MSKTTYSIISSFSGDDNEGYTTKLNSTTSSPAPATRTPLIPMSSSAAFTINGVPEREFHIVVIAVAVVVTSILLIATVVVVVLIILC